MRGDQGERYHTEHRDQNGHHRPRCAGLGPVSWGRPGRNRGSSGSALLPPVGPHIPPGDDQTGFVEILQQVGWHLDGGPGPPPLLVANRYRARRTRRTWALFDWGSYPKPLLGHSRFFG